MNITYVWRSAPPAVIEGARVDVKASLKVRTEDVHVLWTVALWWEVDPFDHRIVAFVDCETKEVADNVATCIKDVLLTMREEQ